MALATAARPAPDLPAAQLERGPRPRAWPRVAEVAIGGVGVGLTLLVLDGSWTWAVVRVLVVGAVVSRAMGVVRRGHRRPVATVVATFGLVATAAGGAITISYAGSGVSVRSVAGLLMTLGGVVLLVIGTTLAVREVRGWWRLLAIPIGLVAAYAVIVPVAFSVYATNVGRPQLARETPADRGFAYEDATFTASDGVTLSGWYLPSTNRAAVVLLHGASSTRSSVLDQAVVVARHGYGVLLYDARGMGRSGGRAMNFGWYGDRDVAAALDYVQTRADVDPTRIAAVGESMGGEEAIGAMAADARVRAVVAEGATNRVAADFAWLSDEYGLRGRMQEGVMWFTQQLTDVFTAAGPPISLRDAVAAAAPRPVLLIAAGNVADEAYSARHTQAAAPGSVQVWVVPGADHTGGLHAQPADWEQRVTKFLDAALDPLATPGSR